MRYIYNDDKYEEECLKINDNTISWQENKSQDYKLDQHSQGLAMNI